MTALRISGSVFGAALLLFGNIFAQNAPKPAKPAAAPPPAVSPRPSYGLPPLGEPWITKTFELKFADPERLRETFSARSFVIEADRDLKELTAHGTPAFIKEVEDVVRRFDVPAPPPSNIEISVYLLTTAGLAPSAGALPPDLAALGKTVSTAGAQALKLADTHMMRLREKQPGDDTSGPSAPDSAAITRIRLTGATLVPGKKEDMVSLSGLQVWLNIPAGAGTNVSSAKTEADVSTDIDVEQNEAVVISRAGTDKPVVVGVRASVAR